ncbi:MULTISPECIES: YoaK family protein [unclassified Acinetobacter]|uniref:YoaK family protein n=1 Tax=unclassified Acinetobacter TaxID=196816 RepID=UPI002362FDAC|nr:MULTISPECIES: YoaK family protein [unclassified Acinetobacter]
MPLQHLPKWVQAGAFMLALNAGMVNVMGLLTVLHQSISHMTGNVSNIAMALIKADYAHVLYLALVLFCYVLGSFYSGVILGNSHFQFGHRYGIPLTLVGLFLLFCWVFVPYFPAYSLLWASAAMGVQNAMVSHYKGTIIRTTHLSGVLTDLGLAFGYLARGLHVDHRRIILHFLILLGFLVGGIIAAVLYPLLGLDSFLVPVALSMLLSLGYWAVYYFYFHYRSDV